MERHCRICFEPDERTPFLRPCNCRGTQAYIHTHCLVMYCRYFPDRICRVCRVQMDAPDSTDALMWAAILAWIVALGYAATLPSDPRGMYLVLTAGMILSFLHSRSLALRYAGLGMLVSASFLFVSFPTIVSILLGFAGVMTCLVLWMYIPAAFLLAGGLIIASCFYSVAIVLFALTRTEPTLAAMLVCILGGVWYSAIRARPPLRIL